ncbi:hypothetical protein BH20ACI2_BH20ACI2_01010 [soil metagenome]
MRDLETLYRQAMYIVDDGEVNFTIRLGQENTGLSQYLAARKAHSWAFLTAYNPNSLPATPEQNAARQAELIRIVEHQGYGYLNGYGTGENWDPEASLFILDISRENALELGRNFGQSAFLWGETDRDPKLVWCQ